MALLLLLPFTLIVLLLGYTAFCLLMNILGKGTPGMD